MDGGDNTPTLSRDALRELDRLCVENFAIPSIVLMENAARGIARHALAMIEERGLGAVDIVCGPGNNAGDGLALARHLHNARAGVRVLLARAPETYKGDALTNLTICQRMGLAIVPPPANDADHGAWLDDAIARAGAPALLVDALLGTGLDRPVGGQLLALIGAINARRPRCPVLSVDIPSGLDADTGRVLGDAVRADLTVTLGARKRGFGVPGAHDLLGRVVVAGIGAPRELIERLADPA